MKQFYRWLYDQPEILTATNTASTSGDNELIAATAGKQIVVLYIRVQLEAATATTILLKHGATTKDRGYLAAAGAEWVREYGELPRKLATNTALNLNLSGANQVGFTVDYILI